MGSWKIMPISRPRTSHSAASLEAQQVAAGEPDRARARGHAAGQQAHDGVRGHRLAGARFADDAEGLPGRTASDRSRTA
jgi:hypothetical protein